MTKADLFEKIIVMGDSWAKGEFPKGGKQGMPCPHGGLFQYINHSKKYRFSEKVRLLQRNGGNLNDNIFFLSNYHSPKNSLYIIFVTNPLRSVTNWRWMSSHKPVDFIKQIQTIKDEFYVKINKWMGNNNSHAVLLGGLTSVNNLRKYPHLTKAIPNIIEFLDPRLKFQISINDILLDITNHDPLFYNRMQKNYITKYLFANFCFRIKSRPNLDLINFFLKHSKRWDKIVERLGFPDGAHPHRGHHYKIYKELQRQNIV